MSDAEQKEILHEYAKNIYSYYRNEHLPHTWYPMFFPKKRVQDNYEWVKENEERFFKGTQNKILYHRWFSSEAGAITAMQFSPNGFHIVVGHSSGLIEKPVGKKREKGILFNTNCLLENCKQDEHTVMLVEIFIDIIIYNLNYYMGQIKLSSIQLTMRHGSTGTVLCTLRNIQFPPKPVHALEYSTFEENICYAACLDGAVYRIEIPHVDTSVSDPPAYCIHADPMLDSLNMQFYGSPGISSYSTPFITQRFGAVSLGILADGGKMAVGYTDSSIKLYDMETQCADLTYKVHKLRLQFIPKKLQRMHFGQVVALRTHPQKPFMFASGAWDRTLRIWDVRCKVGCVMTFEGVNICADSIDLNREQCLAGSWQPTEALTIWDLTARKRLNIIRVQNRRPDVDGEFIYACRFWRSNYNRKGKYGIIGGSGTNCLEVINLHNRYVTCSYPTSGSIFAVTSHEERIAFGGSSTAFTIVSFYDPKHQKEKYEAYVEPDYDYTKTIVTALYQDDNDSMFSTASASNEIERSSRSSTTGTDSSKMSKISRPE